MITRRKAALVMSAIAAVITDKVKAAEIQSIWSTASGTSLTTMPSSVSFDLSSFKDFTFRLGGDTVTFTPEELFKTLSA